MQFEKTEGINETHGFKNIINIPFALLSATSQKQFICQTYNILGYSSHSFNQSVSEIPLSGCHDSSLL